MDGLGIINANVLNELSVKLKYNDHSLLSSIATILDTTQQVAFYSQAKKNALYGHQVHLSASIKIASKKIAADLNNLVKCNSGLKTYQISSLEHLENDHIKSLLLGIIDGDGTWGFSVAYGTLQFHVVSSSYFFLDWILKVIRRNVFNDAHVGAILKCSTYYQISIYRQRDIQAVANWVYGDIDKLCGLYLSRKFIRTKLLQFFLEHKIDKQSRIQMIKFHQFYENLHAKQELSRLICMCQNTICKPPHLHFGPSFINFSNQVNKIQF